MQKLCQQTQSLPAASQKSPQAKAKGEGPPLANAHRSISAFRVQINFFICIKLMAQKFLFFKCIKLTFAAF